MKMQFDETLLQDLDSFIQSYQFTDDKEIYTNGSELIQVSRIKQWFDYNNDRRKELEEENERLKAEVDLLNDNRHYLNNKIGKAIIFIRKNINLNNGALSNREELIVSKHDLIKNETDVLNCLINILKGSEE